MASQACPSHILRAQIYCGTRFKRSGNQSMVIYRQKKQSHPRIYRVTRPNNCRLFRSRSSGSFASLCNFNETNNSRRCPYSSVCINQFQEDRLDWYNPKARSWRVGHLSIMQLCRNAITNVTATASRASAGNAATGCASTRDTAKSSAATSRASTGNVHPTNSNSKYQYEDEQ